MFNRVPFKSTHLTLKRTAHIWPSILLTLYINLINKDGCDDDNDDGDDDDVNDDGKYDDENDADDDDADDDDDNNDDALFFSSW